MEITNKLLSQIQDIVRNCDPSIHIELHKNKQHSVLVILVQEGENKPYKCSDGFFLRVGPNAQKLKRDEIVQFINNVGETHFDEIYNQKFEFPDNFSSNAFQTYLKHCGFNLKASEEDILLSFSNDYFINMNLVRITHPRTSNLLQFIYKGNCAIASCTNCLRAKGVWSTAC